MTIMARAAAVERNATIDGKALAFSNYATCLAMAKGDPGHAAQMFAARCPNSVYRSTIQTIEKAAVAAGTTADASWAAPLAELQPLASAFVDFLRPLSVVEQMRSAFRTVPFNVKVPRQTAGSAVGWTGQGRPTQASPLAFESVSFTFAKIAGIVAITKELAQSSDPAAPGLIRADLASAVAAFTDSQFLDPSISAVTDVSPPSITNGAQTIAASGTTAETAITDIGRLVEALYGSNLVAPFFVMRPLTAARMSSLRLTSGGGFAFPDLGPNGGSILGIPVLTSNGVTEGDASPQLSSIVLLDAAEILFADAGLEIDASENASIELNTAPAHPTAASSVITSFWQSDLIGFRAVRFVNWARRRAGSVVSLTGVQY